MGKKNVVTFRYLCLFGVLIGLILLYLYNLVGTVVREGDFWRKFGIDNSEIRDVDQYRGNILAEDGKLLSVSLPIYAMHLDFKAEGLCADTFYKYLDPLVDSLVTIYPVTKDNLKKQLIASFKKGKNNRYEKISNQKVSYIQRKRMKTFPLLGGCGLKVNMLAEKEMVDRRYPFGSDGMGARTVGGIFKEKDKGARNGLELAYDSILRGEPGKAEQIYIAQSKRWRNIVDPIDGMDVVTTLNVNVMDAAESALRSALQRSDADHGCVVVMETRTGAIKAMCNLKRSADGSYSEASSVNYAVNSKTEPGSTFKIASSVILLENGVDTSEVVDTGNGMWKIHGSTMKDWNYNKGGYGKISLNRGIQVSSNIAVARLVEEKFGANRKTASQFIQGLYDMGLCTPLDLEIPGKADPYIKNPQDPSWSALSLPWISHGYELQFPPINVLTFYNGLANDGKMIQPYIVKSINKDGKVIENKEKVKVINEKLCSASTLKKVKDMMVDVVEKGTATTVKSDYFSIAGKTGTAVYKSEGARCHQLTFCGFFPADNPLYSMIVVVWHPNTAKVYPSAGAISGEVFKKVAEYLYSQRPISVDEYISKNDDLEEETMPITKNGNLKDLRYSLKELNISCVMKDGSKSEFFPCGTSSAKDGEVLLNPTNTAKHLVPNVKGMGAKDAVFLLENRGLKVSLIGVGQVVSQSIQAGTAITKGTEIALNLK